MSGFGNTLQKCLPWLLAKPQTVDAVFPDLVTNDAFRGAKNPRGLYPIAACGLQRVLNEVSLIRADGFSERDLAEGTGGLSGLKRRRKMMGMYDATVANKYCALDRILEFAHVPRPVIGHQHIDRRCGDPPDGLAVLGGILPEKAIGEKQDVGLALP